MFLIQHTLAALQTIQSAPAPGFWSELGRRKLNELKLNEDPLVRTYFQAHASIVTYICSLYMPLFLHHAMLHFLGSLHSIGSRMRLCLWNLAMASSYGRVPWSIQTHLRYVACETVMDALKFHRLSSASTAKSF